MVLIQTSTGFPQHCVEEERKVDKQVFINAPRKAALFVSCKHMMFTRGLNDHLLRTRVNFTFLPMKRSQGKYTDHEHKGKHTRCFVFILVYVTLLSYP